MAALLNRDRVLLNQISSPVPVPAKSVQLAQNWCVLVAQMVQPPVASRFWG